ncbi:hypothetical protein AHF37_02243 [Paragonimus kellicotti]|nr:hypothetical protein AHF37_02243 [Paragonimus kellicotti]
MSLSRCPVFYFRFQDAHNCEPEFDRSRYASLFAVYDGHGGAEVARYCATYLPEFLQKLPAYDKGDPAEALKQLFLDFDASLTTPEKQSGECSKAPMPTRLMEQSSDKLSETSGDSTPDVSVSIVTNDESNEKAHDEQKTVIFQQACNPPGRATDVCIPGSEIARLSKQKQSGECSKAPMPTRLMEQSSDKLSETSGDSSVPEQSAVEIEHKTDSEVLPQSSKESNGDESAVKTTESEGDSEQTVDKAAESEDDDDSEDENVELDEEDLEDEEDDEEDSDDEDDDDDSEEGEEEDDDEDEDVENLRLGIPNALQDQDDNEPGVDSGTTACVALLLPVNGVVKLYVANAGDSRAVLCRGAAAVDLSVDHKPEDEDEKSRITAAGGTVTRDGRVNGGLNLSRALGDHSYKQVKGLPLSDQMITPVPDITQFDLIPGSDEFLVIACDGVWNSMTSQEVISFVYDRLHPCSNSVEEEKAEKVSETDPEEMACRLSKICEELFEHCLAPNTDGDGTGCDNMTCIIVHFHNLDSLIKRSLAGEVTNSHVLVDSRKRTASTEAEIRSDANGVQNSNNTDSAPSETKRSRAGILTGSDEVTVLANGNST